MGGKMCCVSSGESEAGVNAKGETHSSSEYHKKCDVRVDATESAKSGTSRGNTMIDCNLFVKQCDSCFKPVTHYQLCSKIALLKAFSNIQ